MCSALSVTLCYLFVIFFSDFTLVIGKKELGNFSVLVDLVFGL